MSECLICGPMFIGKCPHKLSTTEMMEAVGSWRSDDFGHDCTALLEAESRALQNIIDAAQSEIADLKEKLRVAVEALSLDMRHDFDCTIMKTGKHECNCFRQKKVVAYNKIKGAE